MKREIALSLATVALGFPGLAGGAAGPRPALVASVSIPDVGASASRTPPPDIIRHVENEDMRIAITFDACATRSQGNGFDRAVYRVLQRERVPATIFVSGRWVEYHPRAMQELTADPLIEFANHSYDHPHMQRLSDTEIADQFDRTEAALGRYGQHSVAFRPPFGIFNDRVLEIARDKQLPAVLWDVVSGDPGAGATAAAIVRTVLRQTSSGSIVIFHINGRAAQTAAALPPILRQLRARGFQFVHVSTLLGVSGTAKRSPHVEHIDRLDHTDDADRGDGPGDDAVLPLAGDGISVEVVTRRTRRLAPGGPRVRLSPALVSPGAAGTPRVVNAGHQVCATGEGAACP